MKAYALTLALALSCLAHGLAAQTRVDIGATVSKDFLASPSLDQAARALGSGEPLVGFSWEVVMGHVGLGGSYAVDFNEPLPAEWRLDWNAQAIYASYHILGTRSFLDPFVDAGLGCAGRVYLGPKDSPTASSTADKLALTVYPFVSAGAAIILDGFRLGAKLSYALDASGIPATSIPVYPLGRFQASAYAGLSLGGR